MPLVYTEAIWRSLYKFPTSRRATDPPRILTYQRESQFRAGFDPDTFETIVGDTSPMFNTRKDWLTGYGLDNNARIIVIGCAFGFLLEHLIDVGITDVWGVEPSPWVWANTTEFRPDVLPKVVNATVGVDSTASIQSLFQTAGMPNPRRGDWIVDEDAISSQLDDAGIAAFIAGCEGLLQGNARGRIIHIVTPIPPIGPGDSNILWKTMAEWQAYAPDHTWVDATTGQVF